MKKSIWSNSAKYQKMKKRTTECVYISEVVVMLINITRVTEVICGTRRYQIGHTKVKPNPD